MPPTSRRPSLLRRPETPRAVAMTALALVASFTLLRLAANDWQPGAFVVAGDQLVDPATAPDELPVRADSFGYDGQFFYRLGLDPLTRQETAHGITLDNPPYRQQRIGLAVVAWAVDRATPLPLSVALILVNAIAIVAAAWLGARLALRFGRPAVWGLLGGLSPGVVVGYARDLTEPLAWCLVLGALVLWLDRRYALAALTFTAAALTRETTLLIPGAIGIWLVVTAVRRREPRQLAPAALLLLPLGVALAWQAYLYSVWGEVPLLTGGGHPGTRFFGIFANVLYGAGDFSRGLRDGVLRQLWLVERLWLLGFYAVVALALRRTRLPESWRLGWVFGALLGLSVTAWPRDIQFLRAANEAITMGVLVLLATRSRTADRMLVATGGVSAVVATVYALYL